MRRWPVIAVATAVAATLGGAALAGADAPTGAATVYPLAGASGPTGATGATGLGGLAAGPDHNPWFVLTHDVDGTHYIGTVSAAGEVSEYATDDRGLEPVALAAASGKLWLAEGNSDIGELASVDTTTGVVTFCEELRESPRGMAADASGDLWVTLPNGVEPLGNPDCSTQVNTQAATAAPPAAQSIAAGPDGATMWFTEPGVNSVASITQKGLVTQYPLPSPSADKLGNIVLGPDGNLWLGALGDSGNASYVLRVTPSGVITPSALAANSTADPDVLAAGPDGELWMPDLPGTDGGLTSMTTSGTFATYPGIVPTADTISSMISDPGGADALWMTDQTSNAVYRVPLAPPPPPTIGSTPTPAVPVPPPPTLAATLTAPAAVSTSGELVHGTISEPAGSAPTAVTYEFQYGTSTAYGSSTPSATATATPSGTSVSAPLSGLTPYTTYHYRLVASDCAAASCEAVSPDQTFTTGSTLQPVLHADVGVTTTAGTVLIELRGKHRFVRLRAGQLIPLGATLDTRHGSVLIQSATAQGSGEVASGLFSGGVFAVTQPAGSTATVLVLVSSFKRCAAAKPAQASSASAAKHKKRKVSHKVVNQVFGNAHGQYSTRGHYATAADQGTSWRTADRCDGTQIAVFAGRVTVTDRVRHRTFVLTAGHHYLARTR